MSTAARSARHVLYRDFYYLKLLFSSFAGRPAVRSRRSIACAAIAAQRYIPQLQRPALHGQVHPQKQRATSTADCHHVHEGRQLPFACPGCGALTQSVHPKEAGHYSTDRAAVRKYLHWSEEQHVKEATTEDKIVEAALSKMPAELRAQFDFNQLQESPVPKSHDEPPFPICDRCHHLVHHHSGVSISHPSLDAIEATIAESPHKYNHVYHVIDAADFPMSFVPVLMRRLDFAWMRSRNRRAKTEHWSGGKSGQISFIITRSDLLAPKKEQVNQLMPQLREVLRDAIGKTGKDVRLGNVHLVSSKRGWWTRQVKTDIWDRGGANWLVGKANVGKSNLFEVIYPKGTNEATPDFESAREQARKADVQATLAASEQPLIDDVGIGAANFQPPEMTELEASEESERRAQDILSTSSLLPPPQQEVNYPVMPVTSSLPGTTASPIRIPFGKGKGELIDLPGMERKTLEPYVRPANQLDIVMKQRVIPERIVIKPGSSLVLGGGLIRITPQSPDLIFMAHAFVPMSVHLTSTQKAVELQSGLRDINIPSIMDDGKKGATKRAGTFKLQTNVTKKYAGPLTRKSDAGLTAARLPFVVWATDILIEGCGWVEIVAQVRKPRQSQSDSYDESAFEGQITDEVEVATSEAQSTAESTSVGGSEETFNDDISSEHPAEWIPPTTRPDDTPKSFKNTKNKQQTRPRHPLDLGTEVLAETMPEIEVFSPEGKFIGQRASLSCWLLGGPTDKRTAGRPRRSMKGVKKIGKRRKREALREAS